MKTIKGYAGLEYVEISLKGTKVAAEILEHVEMEVAKAIIKYKPLRGKEILFLRKQLQLSCAKLSLKLGGAFDASTISRWEAKPDERLSPANEMYMRVNLSELFKVVIKARNEELIPMQNSKKLEFAA
jgi:DNA-binding transcriptional regulator YiaG